MNIHERIKEIREFFFDGNNVKFAEKMEESVNTTSGWITGKRGVGINVIEKVMNKFPTINGHWLLTGVGSMELNSQQSVSNIDYKAKCLELEKENYALLKEKDELNKKLTSKLENEITTLKRGAKSEEKVIRKPVHSVP